MQLQATELRLDILLNDYKRLAATEVTEATGTTKHDFVRLCRTKADYGRLTTDYFFFQVTMCDFQATA